MVKTVLAQQEADSLNLMAITYRETLWGGHSKRGVLLHLQKPLPSWCCNERGALYS